MWMPSPAQPRRPNPTLHANANYHLSPNSLHNFKLDTRYKRFNSEGMETYDAVFMMFGISQKSLLPRLCGQRRAPRALANNARAVPSKAARKPTLLSHLRTLWRLLPRSSTPQIQQIIRSGACYPPQAETEPPSVQAHRKPQQQQAEEKLPVQPRHSWSFATTAAGSCPSETHHW